MKMLKVIIVVLLIPSFLLSWGDKGHKIITKYAVKLLPQEMNLSIEIQNAIVEHSSDPDHRKRDVKDEYPKHFIDIDFYKEFENGKMIFSLDSLINIYGDSIVTDMGVLPWATLKTYSNLIDAFKENNKQKIILYASDIAHYIEDGNQPQHTTLNYNGQLTNQKGIHSRYESEMLGRNLNEIEKRYRPMPIEYVSDISNYVFDYITETNSYNSIIFSADIKAAEKTSNVFNDQYYEALWFKTKYITMHMINMGAQRTASLIYSAWVDAGKPTLDKL
jgi:hypothetical protein